MLARAKFRHLLHFYLVPVSENFYYNLIIFFKLNSDHYKPINGDILYLCTFISISIKEDQRNLLNMIWNILKTLVRCCGAQTHRQQEVPTYRLNRPKGCFIKKFFNICGDYAIFWLQIVGLYFKYAICYLLNVHQILSPIYLWVQVGPN